MSIPEIVHLTVATPYPGTELWYTESRKLTTRDYRLFDIQHAVLPTRLPLLKFYEELVKTQEVINSKHMGFGILKEVAFIVARLAMQGQFNFAKMLWKFKKVYNPKRQYSDHLKKVQYQITLPKELNGKVPADELYIHPPKVHRVGTTAAVPCVPPEKLRELP